MTWRVGPDSPVARLIARFLPAEPDASTFSAEHRFDLTEYYLGEDDFERALFWIDLTLEAAPGSERAWSTRGFILAELGRLDEALAAYAIAHRLSEDGEAAFFAALLVCDH